MSEERLNDELRELEGALGCLRPARGAMNRDALMFRAGAASARKRLWPWRAAAGTLAACLVAAVVSWPQPRVVERVVFVPAEPRPVERMLRSPDAAAPDGSVVEDQVTSADAAYVNLRRDVLIKGLDALPETRLGGAAGPASPRDVRELMESLDKGI